MALPTGSPGTTMCSSLFLLLSVGWVLPSGVQAAEVGQGILASRLLRDPRDPSRSRPRLSAVLPRARPAPLRQDTESGQEVQEVDETLVFYSEADLQACVDGALLAAQLGRLDTIPFTYQQLETFKRKLDKTYPQGYPEDVVRRLGSLFSLVSPEDISKWDVRSTETLNTLLRVSRGQNTDAQVAALIARFVAGGARVDPGTLATVAALSPAHLCRFSPEQLGLLEPHRLWELESRDLEGCPLPQMEVLFSKARLAFQNTTGAGYFERIRPYLGGVTTEYLRVLSRQNVSMDMATFKELRTEALRPLTVAEVRGLLGPHVADLKSEERNSPVRDWIAQQRQDDLDTLWPGLQGGIPNGYLVLNLGSPRGRG